MNAASAAALAEMAANLMAGKRKDPQAVADLKNLAAQYQYFRLKFLADIDRDADAFGKVLTALRLPAEPVQAGYIREITLQESFKEAVLVPLDIAKNTLEMMQAIKEQLRGVSDTYITDIAQAHMLAKTALQSLLFHIKANLAFIDDEAFTVKISNCLKEFDSSLECLSNR